MGVIDVDPDLLRREAEAALFAADQAEIHMRAEIVGNIPALMKTIRAHGPYGYTIVPDIRPDGQVRLPVITTYEGIEDCYKMVRGYSDLLSSTALVELRGTWYTFQAAVSQGRPKATGVVNTRETVALFPSSNAPGITGELVWGRVPTETLGLETSGSDWSKQDRQTQRLDLFKLHDTYLAALGAANIEGILATFNENVQGATRDYVHDTGTINSLNGKDEHRAYYQALFAKYEVESVVMLDRAIEEWYAFAELRLQLRRRADGAAVSFHTAEFFVPARDGSFFVRIGHGTDPA